LTIKGLRPALTPCLQAGRLRTHTGLREQDASYPTQRWPGLASSGEAAYFKCAVVVVRGRF